MSEKNGNGKKTYSWIKNNYKFFITILTVIVGATIAWTTVTTKVNSNSDEISEVRNNYEESVEKIFNKLDNEEFGLSAIHQRLKSLEKKN